MLFTLGELIVVIIAFVLITYYIFSVKMSSDIIGDDLIEDMSGNLSNKVFLMKINESNENYSIFKEILDINYYKKYDRNNIKLWIPFFARDIQLDDNDITKAKDMKDSNKIFIEIIYPKILSKSLELVELLDKIKNVFSKEQIILNSCDQYIRYIKDYLSYMILMYINNMVKYELEQLKKNEDKILKIHTLLGSLSSRLNIS